MKVNEFEIVKETILIATEKAFNDLSDEAIRKIIFGITDEQVKRYTKCSQDIFIKQQTYIK